MIRNYCKEGVTVFSLKRFQNLQISIWGFFVAINRSLTGISRTPRLRGFKWGDNYLQNTLWWGAMWQNIRSQSGQNIIEYAIVVALVSAALITMSTYVFRSVQATQKVIEEEFQNE